MITKHVCDKENIIAELKTSCTWLEKSLKEAFQAKLDGIDKATALREIALDKRLEAMNEFRGSLKDQQGNFITRSEHNFVVNDIRELRESRAKLEGKADQSYVNRVLVLSVISILISIIAIGMRLIK